MHSSDRIVEGSGVILLVQQEGTGLCDIKLAHFSLQTMFPGHTCCCIMGSNVAASLLETITVTPSIGYSSTLKTHCSCDVARL